MGTHRMLINPDAIVNITRSGTTFTMTKADGSTATFDQQDNNSDTKVTQTVRTTNGNFPILVRGTSAGTSTTTTTASFAASTTINPSTGLITEAGVQMQRKYGTLIPFGTSVPANANLNTTTYLKVGNYYCSRNVDAATHTNSPTTSAFMMQVFSPLSTAIDNETTGTWVYRFRVLQVYTGARFTQYVYSGETAGTFTYGPWYRTVESEADGDVGSSTQPVYLSDGKLIAANSFAGGTKVILNGTDTGASTATFYAPTGAGTSGQFLKSSGSGAPSWAALPTYSAGTGLTLTNTTFSVSSANVSTMMNLLEVGSSSAQLNDYLIAQYAGGGNTTTTYHRRKVSSVVNATVVKAALGTGSGTTKFLREDGSWATPAYYTLSKAKVEAVLTGAIASHTHNYLPISGGAMTGAIMFNNCGSCRIGYGDNDLSPTVGGSLANIIIDSWYGISFTTSCDSTYKNKTAIGFDCRNGIIRAATVYGAVWNDYAEYRATKEEIEAGRVVIENGDDTLSLAIDRLMPGANIVSDTFGFAIGETENSKTPLAVSGRALAYPYEDRDSYKPGDPVCSGPNGTVSKMTREEVMMYPDRILGTVSAIPNYENWGSGNVAVNGRIWIKVK